MVKWEKSKKKNGLRTKDSLINKIFIVYMWLMFVSCIVLLTVFGLRFSCVYNSQAKAHMNDVTMAAETGLMERISQIDQLSVSILINNSVQENLEKINHQMHLNPEQTAFQVEKAAISKDIRGSVFSISGIVSARIYSLDDIEIVIGSQGKKLTVDYVTKEQIYQKNGGAIWSVDTEGIDRKSVV